MNNRKQSQQKECFLHISLPISYRSLCAGCNLGAIMSSVLNGSGLWSTSRIWSGIPQSVRSPAPQAAGKQWKGLSFAILSMFEYPGPARILSLPSTAILPMLSKSQSSCTKVGFVWAGQGLQTAMGKSCSLLLIVLKKPTISSNLGQGT